MLFRYTTLMLRTALLLGALAFVNVQRTEAQPVSLTKDMPDAFETKKPTVGDGQYYFIQFYEEVTSAPYLFQPFLGEFGEGNMLHAADYLPYAKNRQWTLEDTGANDSDGNRKFRLKSKRGFYAYYGYHSDPAHPGNTTLNKDCFMATATSGNATEFILKARTDIVRTGFTYYELEVASDGKCLSREKGNQSNNEWADMIKNDPSNAHNYVRFAQLKPTAAHIIYYREEGIENSQYRANFNTTRHYLTYSGSVVDDVDVSSRKSIIPADKSLWTLPTAAAYHQDGLWALEESGTDGEFYIKRYGTEQYLNARMLDNGNYISDLGTKDALFGKFKLTDPNANRYTPIQNNNYTSATLANSDFYNWNGYGAGASTTGSATANDDFRFQLGTQVNSGDAIVGTGGVGYLTYADLGSNTKMVINGTAGMQLRVLMNRQEGPTGNEYQGPYVEKNVTIGSDGRAVVDLTYLELNASTTGSATVKMTYINGSDGTLSNDGVNNLPNTLRNSPGEVSIAYSGYNRITGGRVELANKSWGVNDLIYLQVNASAIPGRIARVTLRGTATKSNDNKRSTFWGAGYNNSEWSSTLTWNTADRSITNLTETLAEVTTEEGSKTIELDITNAFLNDPDKIATILLYETNPGGGTFSNPSVEVEYYPTYTYRHLNTIKAGWGSSGTVNSISFVNENNLTPTGARYLHHDNGDGWQVPLWTNQYAGLWNAAFYPVEVPASGKDEFFQVLVGLTSGIATHRKIELSGGNMEISNVTDGTTDHPYGATFTPTGDYKIVVFN